jgi:M6 family metalloprotease-like protein
MRQSIENGLQIAQLRKLPTQARAVLAAAGIMLLLVFPARGIAASEDISAAVIGPRKVLVVAVSFPGIAPGVTLEQVQEKIVRVDGYVRASSYGKAWLETRLAGWYEMPAGLDAYRVSPYNYKVDPARVQRLVADAIGAARKDVDPGKYDMVWILVGVFTRPGEGYGMLCYAANPGMLSRGLGRGEYRPKLETVALPGGGSFDKPTTVSTENAGVGHVVHDMFHALGGLKDGRRVIPDLYDFHLQSNPPPGPMLPEVFAIHAGPWDIMSQHFIERTLPPPAPSSFTRLRMGWIAPDQVVTVATGETREIVLAPLSLGKGTLALRVPIVGDRYLLVENRQRIGDDAVQRSAGMLVLEIAPSRAEGTAIVRAADANPGVARLYAAPFVPGSGERSHYENEEAGVAVLPLEQLADGGMRVLVTTQERARRGAR